MSDRQSNGMKLVKLDPRLAQTVKYGKRSNSQVNVMYFVSSESLRTQALFK